MGERPIRVLHVVGSLGAYNVGGIVRSLVETIRRVDRARFAMDFFTHTQKTGHFDETVRHYGAEVFAGCRPTRFSAYRSRFLSVLGRPPRYDVVQNHDAPLGYPLWLAKRAGIPVRIAHSHNNVPQMQTWRWGARQVLRPLDNYLLDRCATHGLAVSEEAATGRLGRLSADGRCRVLYCGIPLEPFDAPVDRHALRRDFGIEPEAFVVGHVGRFAPAKNHPMVVDILQALVARQPRTRLLLLGDGPLRPSIERYARRQGLGSRAIFAGFREDVERVMRGAMDAMILPSLHEGLARVLLEAQAAGLPTLISDRVPDEGIVVDGLVQQLPLSLAPTGWADALLALCASTQRPTADRALRTMRHSAFAIDNSLAALAAYYRDCLESSRPGQVAPPVRCR